MVKYSSIFVLLNTKKARRIIYKIGNVCDGVMKVTLVITDLKIKIYQNADLVANN